MLLVGAVREELKLPVLAELPIRVWVRYLRVVESSVLIVVLVVVKIFEDFLSWLVVSFAWGRVVVWFGLRKCDVEVLYAEVTWVVVCKGTCVEVIGFVDRNCCDVVVSWGLNVESSFNSDAVAVACSEDL